MQENGENKKAEQKQEGEKASKPKNTDIQGAMVNESEHSEAFHDKKKGEDGKSPEDLDKMSEAASREESGSEADQNKSENRKQPHDGKSEQKRGIEDAIRDESDGKKAYENRDSEDDGRSPENLNTMSEASAAKDEKEAELRQKKKKEAQEKAENKAKKEGSKKDEISAEEKAKRGIEDAIRDESEGKKAYQNAKSEDDGRSMADLEEMRKAETEVEGEIKTEKKPASETEGTTSNSENDSSVEKGQSNSEGEIKTEKKAESSEGKPEQKAKDGKGSKVNADNDKDQQSLDDNIAEDSEDEGAEERYDIEMKDYHAMNPAALTEEFQRLLKNHKVQHIRDHVRDLKMEFEAKYEEEFEQKKEDFLEDGGNIIDFHYSTPVKKDFDKTYFEYREKRDNYYKELKKNLNKNLEERLAIIEDLKNMVGGSGSMKSSFKDFKGLQERWKKAGPVPRDRYKRVWDTYHHHVQNFYDFLHLDREFRDMDFKHNLEQKLKMIARAEELTEEKDINRSFRELQMLHKMWKEDVGPVAKEYREPIWDKFSAATKKIHANRREHFAELDKKREENLALKQQIIDRIWEAETKEIKSHNEAQQNIKKVNALRDKFFNAGRVPKKDNKEIWNNFKEATKKVNHKKNEFYKSLKKDQKENLEKKRELVEIAEQNKTSDDFETVTPLMKKIQGDWKKIGRVPRKNSDKIWKAFQNACNHYFERLHAIKDNEKAEELEAFDKKKELLDKTKEVELEGDHEKDLDKIKGKITEWKEIGAVPQKKKFIEKKFNKALDQLFNQLDIDKKQIEMMKYEKKVQALDEGDDERNIEKEYSFLRKKVNETKDEIRQLETNLEMFSNADKNNPLMKEAYNNIDRHKEQLETWQAKLKRVKAL
jgi:hypothetical protein